MLFLIFFLYLEKEKDAEREGKREGLRTKEIFVERARGAKRGVALSDNPLVQSSCVRLFTAPVRLRDASDAREF